MTISEIQTQIRNGFIPDLICHLDSFDNYQGLLCMTKDGVGFFRIGIDSSIPDVLQFGSLSVEELYRGQGRGKELLRESKLIFQLSDCDFMELWVEENSWMENWYYREGFKEYGTDFSSEPHYKTMRFGKPLDTNNLLKEYHLA